MAFFGAVGAHWLGGDRVEAQPEILDLTEEPALGSSSRAVPAAPVAPAPAQVPSLPAGSGTDAAARETWSDGARTSASPNAALPRRPRFGQRSFGLLAHVLQYEGFGGGVRAGTRWFGVLASAGWQPRLYYVRHKFEYFDTLQINGDLYATFAGADARFAPGFTVGYKYDTLLKSAGAAGFYALVNLTEKLALQGQVGLLIFPAGAREVRRHSRTCDAVEASQCSFGFLSPKVEFGASLGFLFFP